MCPIFHIRQNDLKLLVGYYSMFHPWSFIFIFGGDHICEEYVSPVNAQYIFGDILRGPEILSNPMRNT